VLNKVKLVAVVGFALSVLAFIVPELEIPQGIDVAIVSVILFAASFFRGESRASLRNYGPR
jgi:hypothetical protein